MEDIIEFKTRFKYEVHFNPLLLSRNYFEISNNNKIRITFDNSDKEIPIIFGKTIAIKNEEEKVVQMTKTLVFNFESFQELSDKEVRDLIKP